MQSFVQVRMPPLALTPHAINSVTTNKSMWPFIKVCGVRHAQDMEMLSKTATTAVGVNLVERSPRSVSLEAAAPLVEQAQTLGLIAVVVTLDFDRDQLKQVISALNPDIVQLHGQESSELLTTFPDVRFIKAISWSGRDKEKQLASQWQSSHRSLVERGASSGLVAFLVDAFAPVEGGGTGRMARWDLLQPRPQELGELPLILAGGLTPYNVTEAISAVSPDGVDAASGVESSPGKKSAELTAAFASNSVRQLHRDKT